MAAASSTTQDTKPWTAGDLEQEKEAREELDVWPLDEYNAALLNQVHPRGYVQSHEQPHEVYDLIAIGEYFNSNNGFSATQ